MQKRDLRGATLAGFSMGGGEVTRLLARHGAGRAAKAVLIPGAHLMEHPGAPHSLFYTKRDRLNADLLAFIKG